MGRWFVQVAHDLQGRLPDESAQVQIRAGAVPPERVSIGHRLPVAARRGQGLAPGDHHQTDPARHPGSAQRTQHQGPGTGRGVHNLLPKSTGVRETSARPGTSHGRYRIGARSRIRCGPPSASACFSLFITLCNVFYAPRKRPDTGALCVANGLVLSRRFLWTQMSRGNHLYLTKPTHTDIISRHNIDTTTTTHTSMHSLYNVLGPTSCKTNKQTYTHNHSITHSFTHCI